jgi:hypothetical protein
MDMYEERNYAPRQRKIEKSDLQEYLDRSKIWKTSETSCSDSDECSREEQEEINNGQTQGEEMKKATAAKKPAAKPSGGTKTATATRTATATKTSTDAYTQGNIIVTGGAGKGATNVKIDIPGLANKDKKAVKAKGKK